MKLVELMSEELILPQLEATHRDEALRALVSCVVQARPGIDAAGAFRVLQERERIGSTAIGNGLAIPHAKLPLSQAITCFARAPAGIEFGALDGQPAHLFLAILAPEGKPGAHLKVLARASRLFMDLPFRERLLGAEGRAELWSLLQQRDEALG